MALLDTLQQLTTSFNAVGAAATGAAQQAKAAMSDLAQTIKSSGDKMNSAIDGLRKKLDDGKGMSQELKLQLDLLEVGGQRLDTFLGKFGDVVVKTDAGMKTIRDLFDKFDAKGAQDKMQRLANEVLTTAGGVQKALDALNSSTNQYAKTLHDVAEAVRSGQAPLDELLSLVKKIKEAYPGSGFADLADALAQQMQQSNRNHP